MKTLFLSLFKNQMYYDKDVGLLFLDVDDRGMS